MTDIPLSDEDHQALASWDLGQILSAVIPTTGTVNRTIIVDAERGRFVLRVSKRGLERIKWEHTCITWVAERGLPVCRPIPLPGGRTFLQRGEQFFSLSPTASGQQIIRGKLNSQQARAAGECLAHIHAAFHGFPAKRTRTKNLTVDISAAIAAIPRIQEAIHRLPVHTETEVLVMKQLVARYDWLQGAGHLSVGLQDRLDALPKVGLHGDYQETNLFFQGDHVSAVIDWDQAGFGARGWEVIRVLHLMFDLDLNRCRDFLDGYRSFLALPDSKERSIVGQRHRVGRKLGIVLHPGQTIYCHRTMSVSMPGANSYVLAVFDGDNAASIGGHPGLRSNETLRRKAAEPQKPRGLPMRPA